MVVFLQNENRTEALDVSAPIPSCNNNPDGKYWINRIRISKSLADDYSKKLPID